MLHAARLQAKLTVGPADDVYEREADRVADAVMGMPEPEAPPAEAAGAVRHLAAGAASGGGTVLRRQTIASFRTALEGVSADHAAVIGTLFSDARFARMVRFLERCPAGTIEFFARRVVSRVAGQTIERFGGYMPPSGGAPGQMLVNPVHPDHVSNPLEMVDTIVHEFMHAVIDLGPRCRSPSNPYPLPATVLDAPNDPELAAHFAAGRDLSRADVAAASAAGETTASGTDVREYLESTYGPSASNPRSEYVDLNRAGLEMVVAIMTAIRGAHPGIGRETVSFDNTELFAAADLLGTRPWLNARQRAYSMGLFKDRVARERGVDPALFSEREYDISAIQVVENADRRTLDRNAGGGWGPIGPVWVCEKRSRFTGRTLRTIVTGAAGSPPGGGTGYRIVQHT